MGNGTAFDLRHFRPPIYLVGLVGVKLHQQHIQVVLGQVAFVDQVIEGGSPLCSSLQIVAEFGQRGLALAKSSARLLQMLQLNQHARRAALGAAGQRAGRIKNITVQGDGSSANLFVEGDL